MRLGAIFGLLFVVGLWVSGYGQVEQVHDPVPIPMGGPDPPIGGWYGDIPIEWIGEQGTSYRTYLAVCLELEDGHRLSGPGAGCYGNCMSVPGIEVGLREDGVIVWREKE